MTRLAGFLIYDFCCYRITHIEFCSAVHMWDYVRNVRRIMFGKRTGASREETYWQSWPETRKFPEVQIFFTASSLRPIDR